MHLSMLSDACKQRHTLQSLDLRLQREGGIGFEEDFDDDPSFRVASADELEQPRCARYTARPVNVLYRVRDEQIAHLLSYVMSLPNSDKPSPADCAALVEAAFPISAHASTGADQARVRDLADLAIAPSRYVDHGQEGAFDRKGDSCIRRRLAGDAFDRRGKVGVPGLCQSSPSPARRRAPMAVNEEEVEA